MRSISRAIDRFCAKHRRFGIPQLIRYIIFCNVSVYIITTLDLSGTVYYYLLFNPSYILRGQVWRLFTWVFLPIHGSFLTTALALYLYFFIGNTMENEWGSAKFSLFYFSGVFLNLIYGFLMWMSSMSFVLTPMFLNLSLFFAFAVSYPDYQLTLFFVIPVKIKWLALINAAYFIYSIYVSMYYGSYAQAFIPMVAFLNFFIICGGDLLDYLRPLKSRASARTINFRREVRQTQRNQDTNQYRHKCSVCGKTDKEHPSLEFRYCSRCEGYHCFCSEHINQHVHFRG